MPRYANKQDGNAKEIDDALALVPGVTVAKLGGWTIDRIVGYRGANYLIEYKQIGSEKKLKPSQIKFIQEWTGQVNICTSFEDVLLIIGARK